MTNKHTPAPWYIDGDYLRHDYEENGKTINGIVHFRESFGVGRKTTPEEAKANALLRAAAPEMLAALEEAENMLYAAADKDAPKGSIGHDTYKTLSRVVDAINKAKGL